MRVAAYSAIAGTTAIGAAGMTEAPPGVHYGALSILAWTIWYLLARALPALRKAQEADRKSFLAAQEKTSRDFRYSLADMQRAITWLAGDISRSKTGQQNVQEADTARSVVHSMIVKPGLERGPRSAQETDLRKDGL